MAQSSSRLFPREYYHVTTTNTRLRPRRWFCNRPLSPVTTTENQTDTSSELIHSILDHQQLQEAFVSTSEKSTEDSNGLQTTQLKSPDFDESLHDQGLERLLQDSSVSTSEKSTEDSSGLQTTQLKPPDIEESLHDQGLEDLFQNNSDDDPEYQPSSSSSTEEDSDNECMRLRNSPGRTRIPPKATEISHSSETLIKKKNSNFCYFCEDVVINFARHVYRNHSTETEVQQMLAAPTGSKKRKELLCSLRKKGNYLANGEDGKPIRKNVNTTYLPCPECLGFYSSKNLWKHKKICCKNQNNNKSSQTDSHNFMVRHLKIDSQLRETVFPRMRADKISLAAKKDLLICAFGARYMKIHREKHFVNVTSRKMRELAKILIELRKMNLSITNLFEALKPQNYDMLVMATKQIARYDSSKESYEAPSLALNMGTSLKQCCEIALMQILKRKHVYGTVSAAEIEADVKTLIQLIEAHWKFDVSSQASNDLNIKKWNKVTIIPLASDLKLLKEYLLNVANNAIRSLRKNSTDLSAYTQLVETIFYRVILLNRKRPGELQRFPLHIYETSVDETTTYEEFTEAVNETERALMKNFKRVVVRGKRGRGVPVLFSTDVQEHLGILLQYRKKNMKKPNTYLFGNPASSEPVVGYKVLKKYALVCGAKNRNAITCTKLRKHLATLTQLFNMTDNDMEQLASFMGHTVGVHRSSYRLPDDIYQTAKISKLLILMEKGEAGQFKGKSLDQINIDLDEDLLACDEEKDPEDDEIDEPTNELVQNEGEKNCNVNSKEKLKKRVLVPWTNEQKKIVINYFQNHINQKRPPKRFECEDIKKQYPEVLENKGWLKIKVFVQNKYTKK